MENVSQNRGINQAMCKQNELGKRHKANKQKCTHDHED